MGFRDPNVADPMVSYGAQESAVVDAPPEKVYRILADYRVHHSRILPRPYFQSLTVEKGGEGAGTVIRVAMKVMGQHRELRMEVAEPVPGRVLCETDTAQGVVTTFTVAPAEGGARSAVTIATEWPAKPGVAGWLERLGTPRVARRIYRKQLRLLDEYAKQAK